MNKRKQRAYTELYFSVFVLITLMLGFSMLLLMLLHRSQVSVSAASSAQFGEQEQSKTVLKQDIRKHFQRNDKPSPRLNLKAKPKNILEMADEFKQITNQKLPQSFKLALQLGKHKTLRIQSNYRLPTQVKKKLLQFKVLPANEFKSFQSYDFESDVYMKGKDFHQDHALEYGLHAESLLKAGFKVLAVDLIAVTIIAEALL